MSKDFGVGLSDGHARAASAALQELLGEVLAADALGDLRDPHRIAATLDLLTEPSGILGSLGELLDALSRIAAEATGDPEGDAAGYLADASHAVGAVGDGQIDRASDALRMGTR